jgi:hypothetical protein
LLWDPISNPTQADLLLPFLPTPLGNVGIGIAMRENTYNLTELTNKIPVRLSTFTTNLVSINYAVYTEDGLYNSGSLSFTPGETLKFIEFAMPDTEGLHEVHVMLSSPVNADITGYQQVVFMVPYEIEVMLIETGDVWKYFKGTSEPPANWNDLGFNDSGWLSGATGIGYEADTGYGPCIATNLTDMRNGYMSVYARRIFTIDDPDQMAELIFSMDFDDGYIAYINGVPVDSQYPPSPVAYNQPATGSHEASCGGIAPAIDLSDYIDLLVAGDNVLAVQAHNTTIDSSDFILVPQLSATITPWPGDLEPDGDVDIVDLAGFAAAWLSQPGDGNYNPLCNIDSSEEPIINLLDLEVLSEHWLFGL